MPKVHYMHDKIGPMKDAVGKVILPKGYAIETTTQEGYWKIKKGNKEVGNLDAAFRTIFLKDNNEQEVVTKIAEALEKAHAGKVEIEIMVRTK